MNRMAILCALLVAGLTAVVLVEHRRGDAGDLPADDTDAGPPATQVASVPAAAPGGGPLPAPSVEVAPAVDLAALRARITEEVVTPLAESWARRLSFSRVRQPSPEVSLRMPPTERAPRPDDEPDFTYFAIHQQQRRHPGDDAPSRSWLHGRVARDGGMIELAYVRRGDEAVGPWYPVSEMLERLTRR